MALYWWPEMKVLQEYPTNGPEVIDTIIRTRPDVAVLDFWLPDMEGPAVAGQIKKLVPDTKVILVSSVYGPLQVKLSLSAGAVGFLPKTVTVAQTAEAIKRAQSGESPVFAEQLEGLLERLDERAEEVGQIHARLRVLTPRELELLRRLNHGHSIPEIAKDLSIAQATVRDHFHNMVTKTGARTKEQVLALAKYCGLISS